MIPNYYQILGVPHDASLNDIKKAYRLYASKFHPDKHKGDDFFSRQFIIIKKAYDVLSDPSEREKYDQMLFSYFTDSKRNAPNDSRDDNSKYKSNKSTSSQKNTNNKSSSNIHHNYFIYAGFGRRTAAYLIDIFVVLFIEMFIYFVILLPILFDGFSFYDLFEEVIFLSSSDGIISHIFIFILSWAYFSFMESTDLQATIGKLLLKIKVTDYNGDRISFSRASARYLGKLASLIIFGIGFIMILFTKRKQGLHDLWAKCLLIRR